MKEYNNSVMLSRYCLSILKEAPRDAVVASHKLMMRSGMIHQLSSGMYCWLPLGCRALQNVERIVREEFNKIGAHELILPLMQPADLWKQSGRYNEDGGMKPEMLMAKDRHGHELIFSPTAEEIVSAVYAASVQSYRGLPKIVYQIHWKFRDEIRPRHGVLRCKEFLMQDAYSFHLSENEAMVMYEGVLAAQLAVYKRIGLYAIPVLADSGAIGGDYCHEIHVLAASGDSTIYYDKRLLSVDNINLMMLNKHYSREELRHSEDDMNKFIDIGANIINSKSIEIGHLFFLGQKYSKVMNLKVQDATGEYVYPQMGCYGIGVSRLVGAIIEANHDDRGIIWPIEIAPFQYIITNLAVNDAICKCMADEVYCLLINAGKSVMYDDLDESVGVKFANADLLGIPIQIIVGKHGAVHKTVEVRLRNNKSVKIETNIENVVNCCNVISFRDNC